MRRVRCPVVIGRDEELGVLTEVVVGAIEGRGGAAFVLGEPGIGKSRLIGAAADIARSRDVTVLRGRAAPSPAPVPYRPLAEAFLSVVRRRDIEGDGLDRFRAAMPALVPGWRHVGEDAAPSVVLLGEATIALAERCAGPAGALIVLEDLHWADAETCELVDYLSDKLDATPIALVASVRTGEVSNAERLAYTVAARRDATAVVLQRLDANAVEAVIGASLGTAGVPEPLRAAVTDASGGVPLLVEEFLASLIEGQMLWRDGDGWRAAERLPALVPASFAALVADRVAALSVPARQVLDAAAVIGEQIEWRLLAAVCGLDEGTTIDSLREAVRAQLVDEVSSEPSPVFRFHHGLSRAAVLDRTSEPNRRAVATLALTTLDAEVVPTDGERLGMVAALAMSAGDTGRAVRALIEASVAARRQGACASARAAAERASELARATDERADAHEALLDACVAAGDVARAVDVGRQLLVELAHLSAEPTRRCEVHLRLAEAAVAATDCERADRHLEEALLLCPTDDVRTRADLVRASVALCRHLPDDAATHAGSALEEATTGGDPARVAEAAALLGRAYRVTDVDAARRAFTDALDAAHHVGDRLLVAKAAHELATIDVLFAGPTGPMQEARRLAEEAGALALVAVCDNHLSVLHWLHFDLEACRESAERAVDAAVRYHLGLLAPAAALMAASADSVLGRRLAATEVFERYRPMMDDEIEATSRGHALGMAALACEDRAGAMEQFELSTALAPPYSDVARAPHCGMRALLLALEGSPTAAGVARELERDAAVVGVPRALVDLALAILSGRGGDAPAAQDRANHAFDALQPTPWFRAISLRLLAEAAIEDRWGDPPAWLRTAHQFFDDAGVIEPAAACSRLLRRAGAPVPRPATDGQHPELARLGITPRESEVLFFVASGRSNRDIAEQLVLSVRTVEKHVERLMTKTSTANRTQLAAFATRLLGPVAST